MEARPLEAVPAPFSRSLWLGYMLLVISSIVDGISGLVLVYFESYGDVALISSIVLYILDGAIFLWALGMGLDEGRSYFMWGLLASFFAGAFGWLFLGQSPTNGISLVVGSVLGIAGLGISTQLAKEEGKVVKHRFGMLLFLTLYLTGAAFIFTGSKLPGVTYLWVVVYGMYEVLGVPLFAFLDSLNQRARNPLLATLKYVSFTPSILVFTLVIYLNDGLLLVSNVLGNTASSVGALMLFPWLFGRTRSYSKLSWVGMILSLAGAVLIRYAFW
jgi:hypothetical protein